MTKKSESMNKIFYSYFSEPSYIEIEADFLKVIFEENMNAIFFQFSCCLL